MMVQPCTTIVVAVVVVVVDVAKLAPIRKAMMMLPCTKLIKAIFHTKSVNIIC